MTKPKSIKPNKTAHTANTKYGMGDYYGTGVKQPMGIMREDQLSFNSVKKKNLGKPPKALA